MIKFLNKILYNKCSIIMAIYFKLLSFYDILKLKLKNITPQKRKLLFIILIIFILLFIVFFIIYLNIINYNLEEIKFFLWTRIILFVFIVLFLSFSFKIDNSIYQFMFLLFFIILSIITDISILICNYLIINYFILLISQALLFKVKKEIKNKYVIFITLKLCLFLPLIIYLFSLYFYNISLTNFYTHIQKNIDYILKFVVIKNFFYYTELVKNIFKNYAHLCAWKLNSITSLNNFSYLKNNFIIKYDIIKNIIIDILHTNNLILEPMLLNYEYACRYNINSENIYSDNLFIESSDNSGSNTDPKASSSKTTINNSKWSEDINPKSLLDKIKEIIATQKNNKDPLFGIKVQTEEEKTAYEYLKKIEWISNQHLLEEKSTQNELEKIKWFLLSCHDIYVDKEGNCTLTDFGSRFRAYVFAHKSKKTITFFSEDISEKNDSDTETKIKTSESNTKVENANKSDQENNNLNKTTNESDNNEETSEKKNQKKNKHKHKHKHKKK